MTTTTSEEPFQIPVVQTAMPQQRYTIPADQVVVAILSKMMPGVHVATSTNTNGVRQLPSIRFRKFSGSSVDNSPSGRITAASWVFEFDCLHDSRRNAELLGDWLYSSLERLVDPNVPGHEVIVHEGSWISNVEETELPDRSTMATDMNLAQVQISFTLTFRRMQ